MTPRPPFAPFRSVPDMLDSSIPEHIDVPMLEDRIKAHWKDLSDVLKARWAALTDDDLNVARGCSEYLSEKLQQRYGIGRDEALKQVEQFDREF